MVNRLPQRLDIDHTRFQNEFCFRKRFFDVRGIDQNSTLNAKPVKELFDLALDVA